MRAEDAEHPSQHFFSRSGSKGPAQGKRLSLHLRKPALLKLILGS